MSHGVTLGRLGLAVAFFAVWQIASATFASYVLPSPLVTAQTVVTGIREGWLVGATLVTLKETIPAFLIAATTGFALGVLLGVSRFWGSVFEPMILGTYAIPKITLYPIFLLVFKVGSASKIAFGFFHGVFPIQIVSQAATANLNPVFLKVARTLGLSPWQIAVHVVMPAIFPALIVGLRLAFSLTFIGVVLGEMIASNAGLGFLLSASDATFDLKRTLAVLVVLAVIGVGANALFFAWERRMTPLRAGMPELDVARK
ncbi:MAG: ABC transporter permease [Candidatus Eremiobacteraeota bacterium]|nr:ABC transporter permease [Candidatus Eremiobacteraeota bacterium]